MPRRRERFRTDHQPEHRPRRCTSQPPVEHVNNRGNRRKPSNHQRSRRRLQLGDHQVTNMGWERFTNHRWGDGQLMASRRYNIVDPVTQNRSGAAISLTSPIVRTSPMGLSSPVVEPRTHLRQFCFRVLRSESVSGLRYASAHTCPRNLSSRYNSSDAASSSSSMNDIGST